MLQKQRKLHFKIQKFTNFIIIDWKKTNFVFLSIFYNDIKRRELINCYLSNQILCITVKTYVKYSFSYGSILKGLSSVIG